jgi:hypothetical protein
MARGHNELHGAGAIQRALVESVGSAGYDVAVERLGETLTPIIDLWSQPEWRLSKQEYLGSARLFTAAGGAGFRTRIGLRNTSTVDDPWLVVVQSGTHGRGGAGVQINAAITFTDQADSAPLVVRDGRSRIAPPFMRLRTQNGDALPAGIAAGEFLTDDTKLELKQDVVLRFGQALYFYPNADNTALNTVWYVRSRRMYPGERTGAT